MTMHCPSERTKQKELSPKIAYQFGSAILALSLLTGSALGVTADADTETQSNVKGMTMAQGETKVSTKHGYLPVNGLNMYYEIEGSGYPLVYIPPAFGYAGLTSFPALAANHSVITIDLQGNGRTADLPDRPLSIEQYASDVVELLKQLGIAKADFFGDSYGGSIAAMIAIRHPEIVRRVVACSATFGPPEVALNPVMTHYERPPTAEGSAIQFQRENYKKVAPAPEYWPKIYEKVGMIPWRGFAQAELASIKVPLLIIVGDHDFVRIEHAVETFNLIPGAEIAVIPSASHFVVYSEQEKLIPIVKHFLEKPAQEIPLATAELGYHPGNTR